MRIFLMYRAAIHKIAEAEGLSPSERQRLVKIAERSIHRCSSADALRVAYIVWCLLRPGAAH